VVATAKRVVDVNNWLQEVERLADKYRNVTVSFQGSTRHKRHRLRGHEALIQAWHRVKEGSER